jgi:hypothetical protein
MVLPTEFFQREGVLPGTLPPRTPPTRRPRRVGVARGGLRPAAPAPGALPALPQELEEPVLVGGELLQPLADDALFAEMVLIRDQLDRAKTISVQEALDPQSPGYQEGLEREPGWLLQAADWIQKNLDQPLPGLMSLSIASLADPKRNPIEDFGDIFDYLFTGDNAETERLLRSVGVALPKDTPSSVGESMLSAWKTFGEYQDKRPELFMMEKFLEEMFISPVNMLPIGLGFRMAWRGARMPNVWSWIARKQSFARNSLNPLAMNNTGRLARHSADAGNLIGFLMNVPDHTGRTLSQLPSRRAAGALIRRLEAFRDGHTERLQYLGEFVKDQRALEMRDVLRTTDIDFNMFFQTLRKGRRLTPAQVESDILSAVERRAAGGDTWLIAEGKRSRAAELGKGGRRLTQAERAEVLINGGKIKPNIVFRATQSLKGGFIAPLMIGLIPRWTTNSTMFNLVVMGLIMPGHFLGKIPRVLSAQGRALKRTFTKGLITGEVPPTIKTNFDRLGLPQPDYLAQGMGFLQETFGKQELPGIAGAPISAGFLERVPILGAWVRLNARTNSVGDLQIRATTAHELLGSYFSGNWRSGIKGLRLPKDLEIEALSIRSVDDFERFMRAKGGFEQVVTSNKSLIPVHEIQDQHLQRLVKDVLDDLPDDIEADDLYDLLGKVGDDYASEMNEAAQALRAIDSADIREAAEGLQNLEIQNLDDAIEAATDDTTKNILRAFQKEEASGFDPFLQELLGDDLEVGAAWRQIGETLDVFGVKPYAEALEEQTLINVRRMHEDFRITREYYERLQQIPINRLVTEGNALRVERGLLRTQSRKAWKKDSLDSANEINAALKEAKEAGQDIAQIPLDTLMPPKRVTAQQMRKWMDEAGIDWNLHNPDAPPQLYRLMELRREQGLDQLGDVLKGFREGLETVPSPAGALAGERATSIRRIWNQSRLQASNRALERTEESHFNYQFRNNFDYFLNHFAPFPFWSIRYVTMMIQRSVEEPRTARAILLLLGQWQESVQNDPLEARFSMATPFTTPGGSKVRFNPMYMIMPLGSPAISFLQFGTDWRDLSQAVADVQDVFGAYFYPHVEFLASAMDDILQTQRTGGVGMARSASEILMDFSPIGGMSTLGINTFGYNAVRSTVGQGGITDAMKGKIFNAIMGDLDSGKLTDYEKAREAVESIKNGQPNAMAALYAKKALGRSLLERFSSAMGLPIKLIPPELDVSERGRRLLYERPKAHPFQLRGSAPAVHPDLRRIARQAYPGLEIVSGQRIPAGMTTKQADVWKILQATRTQERAVYDNRDTQLGRLMEQFRDPENPLGHKQMWELRRSFYADAAAAVLGEALRDDEGNVIGHVGGIRGQAREQAQREGLGEVPFEREERERWWLEIGREILPVHPLDLAYERFLEIEAEEFPDNTGLDQDWEAFYDARESYLDNIPDYEKQYILRRLADPTAPDADIKRGLEVLRPFWQLRDDIFDEYDRLSELEEQIALADKRNDPFARKAYENDPLWKLFLTRLKLERDRMRMRDPLVEHYVVLLTNNDPLGLRR